MFTCKAGVPLFKNLKLHFLNEMVTGVKNILYIEWASKLVWNRWHLKSPVFALKYLSFQFEEVKDSMGF